MNKFKNLHTALGSKSFTAAAILFSLFALSGHFSLVNGQSPCGLGTSWDESESGWTGKWIRRGASNNFDATFTLGGGQVKSGLSIYLGYNGKVAVKRSDASDNVYRVNRCFYDGQLASDGISVSGTYSCTREDGSKTGTYNWSAKINCEGTAEITKIRQWIAYYDNLINQWTQYRDQKVAPYYNHPTYYKWARKEYEKANQTISSLQQKKAYYQNLLWKAGVR
jgi:hypothetical protein